MPVDHEDYLPGEAPAAHKETHQDGGTDEISIADLAGVSTELAAHALQPTVHQDAPALIAVHQAIAAAHHVRYSDAEVTAIANGLIAAHTAIAAAHHARYTDAEAKVVSDAGIATHAALATVHQDAPALIATHTAIATAHQDAPALILTHKGDASAHHAKYTDAEAIATVKANNIILAINKYFEGLTQITGDMPQQMLMNGGFEETDGTNAYYWTSGAGIATKTSGGDDSNKYIALTRSGATKTSTYCNPDGTTHYFEVNEGERYEVGGSLKSSHGSTSAILSMWAYDKDKAFIEEKYTYSSAQVWTASSTTYTVPSGVKFLIVNLRAHAADGWAAFDNVYLKRVDELAWSFTHASDHTKIDTAKLYDVTYGVNDSGGEGYKVLRIPN